MAKRKIIKPSFDYLDGEIHENVKQTDDAPAKKQFEHSPEKTEPTQPEPKRIKLDDGSEQIKQTAIAPIVISPPIVVTPPLAEPPQKPLLKDTDQKNTSTPTKTERSNPIKKDDPTVTRSSLSRKEIHKHPEDKPIQLPEHKPTPVKSIKHSTEHKPIQHPERKLVKPPPPSDNPIIKPTKHSEHKPNPHPEQKPVKPSSSINLTTTYCKRSPTKLLIEEMGIDQTKSFLPLFSNTLAPIIPTIPTTTINTSPPLPEAPTSNSPPPASAKDIVSSLVVSECSKHFKDGSIDTKDEFKHLCRKITQKILNKQDEELLHHKSTKKNMIKFINRYLEKYNKAKQKYTLQAS
ncbi:hypothetical protein AKO1_015599 [Acrasis kona]|uniref:Set2 Rpb1 interacting domain-containing protein n=1 Tax=Acrasis kona TaxID=1008807 RepID=A0AAW2ZER8_9EUKA